MKLRDRKKKFLDLIIYWLPVLIQMALIFYFSSQPEGSKVLESFPTSPGIGHLIGYAILSFLLYRAFNQGLSGWNVRAAGNAFVFGLIYAVSDELHQVFVPGRQAAIIDVGIDTVGIILGLLLVRVLSHPAVSNLFVGRSKNN
ncbi:MAG: VanZ family protein [Bacillota bacterium]